MLRVLGLALLAGGVALAGLGLLPSAEAGPRSTAARILRHREHELQRKEHHNKWQLKVEQRHEKHIKHELHELHEKHHKHGKKR